MDTQQHIKLLQLAYAGALADTVRQLGQEGALERVAARKRQEQLATGRLRAAQFGITAPEEVFTRLSELFGCAVWQITPQDGGFVAEANACLLCGLAKKVGAPQPCDLYCLSPMEGMVRGVAGENVQYTVEETLWDGGRCRVCVTG